jgi:DNA repair protein RadA/Sms
MEHRSEAQRATMPRDWIWFWPFWKRAGFRLGAKDVFLNITGGISVDDPAIDLAVVAAILSNEDIPVNRFCLLEKLVYQEKFVPEPRWSTHSRSRKLGFSYYFRIQYNKITLKNTE